MSDPRDKPDDRRLHTRVAIDLVVRLKFQSVEQFLQVHSRDLSRGGMFVKGLTKNVSGVPLQPLQRLQLQFDAGGERVVSGEARVVRVTREGVALEFVDLAELSAELIEAILSRDLLDKP